MQLSDIDTLKKRRHRMRLQKKQKKKIADTRYSVDIRKYIHIDADAHTVSNYGMHKYKLQQKAKKEKTRRDNTYTYTNTSYMAYKE